MKATQILPNLLLCLMLAACNGGGGGDGGNNEPPPVNPPPTNPPPVTPPPNSGQIVGTVNRLLPAPAALSTFNGLNPKLAVVVRDQTTWSALLAQYPSVMSAVPPQLQAPNFNEVSLILIGIKVPKSSNQNPLPPSLETSLVLSNNQLWGSIESCNSTLTFNEEPNWHLFSIYTGPVLPENAQFNWVNREPASTCQANDINTVNIVQ